MASRLQRHGDAPPPPALPAFAARVSQPQDEEVQALERRLRETRQELEVEQRRRSTVEQNAERVRLQVVHGQSQWDAHREELEQARHLLQLAQRSVARLRADAVAQRAQHEELDQRAAALELACLRAEDKAEQVAAGRQWTREQLETWAGEERARVEEGRALERERRRDERGIKDIMTQLESASLAAVHAEREAAGEAARAQTARAEVARGIAHLRELQAERQRLRQRWEGVAVALRQRDASLRSAAEAHVAAADDLAALQQQAQAARQACTAEAAAGAALQQAMKDAERRNARLQADCAAAEAAAAQQAEQATLTQSSLLRLKAELKAHAAGNERRRGDAQQAALALAAALQRRNNLNKAAEDAQAECTTAQQQCAALDALLRHHQGRAAEAERNLVGVSHQHFAAAQATASARERGKQLQAELAGAAAQERNLRAKLATLAEQRAAQEEILYNVSYRAVMAQRAAARAGGERTHEETAALHARIAALTAALEEAAAEVAALDAGVKHAQGDCARAARHGQQLAAATAAARDGAVQAELAAQQAQRALRAASNAREAKLVQVDLAAVQVYRLKSLLLATAQQAAGAECRKEALQGAVAATRAELEAAAAQLQREALALQSDLHQRTLDVRECQAAAAASRAKYEALQLKHAPSEGEEAPTEEGLAQRAAEQEVLLQRQVEALRASVAAAEADRATLLQAAAEQEAGNDAVRLHARYGGEVHLAEEQAELRAQLAAARAACATEQRREAAAGALLQQARDALEAKELAYSQTLSATAELENQVDAAQRQVAQQRGRRERAAQRCAAARAKLAKAGALPGGLTLAQLEADMDLGEKLAAIEGMLGTLCSNNAPRPAAAAKPKRATTGASSC